MKLKTTRPWLRDWFSVLIGPAIWLALLLLVAGRNAYSSEAGPLEAGVDTPGAPANAMCPEVQADPFAIGIPSESPTGTND